MTIVSIVSGKFHGHRFRPVRSDSNVMCLGCRKSLKRKKKSSKERMYLKDFLKKSHMLYDIKGVEDIILKYV